MATQSLNGDKHGVLIEFLDCCPEPVGVWDSDAIGFTHVALAYWHGRDNGRNHVNADNRLALRSSFSVLKQAFEREHGAICRSFFARSAEAAAVLTTDDEIAVVLGHDLPACSEEIVATLRRCQQIGYMAWHRLAQYDRRLCQLMVFSVIEELLRRLDQMPASPSGEGGALEPLRATLDEAEDFMLRCAGRRAQIRYLKGMLVGTVLAGAVLALIAVIAASAHGISQIGGELLIVATSGAIGAFVSVLARMTSGTFRMNLPTLSFEMRSTDLWLMGSLRPLVGLIFALAAYVLVVSALVPMQASDPETKLFLYAAVGFLAGFSERFAQDVFVRSGQAFAGPASDSPATGPSAGLAGTRAAGG